MAKLSFSADIRPLFRTFDVESMEPAGLDLSSYEAVKGQAAAIFEALTDKRMPCDAPWSQADIQKFKFWMDDGMLP
jgi:hypothetical protein